MIGVSDEKLGQRIVLIAETNKQPDLAEVMKTLKHNLQIHLVPREVIFVQELPRTSSFKIDRSQLANLISH